MVFVKALYILFGAAICFFFLLFSITSNREKKSRAAFVSLLCSLLFGVIWYGAYLLLSFTLYFLLPIIIIALFILFFLIPLGKISSIQIGKINERVDERDVMFAREEYHPGSEKYETYYAMRPGNKEIDDKLRDLPELFKPGGKYYDPVRSKEVDAIFEKIEGMLDQVDGKPNSILTEMSPEKVTTKIKQMVLRLGAQEVGIAHFNPAYVYSHVGRGPEEWGKPIENKHKFVIAFTLEMDYEKVETAPQLPITEETAKKYLKGARISIGLAIHIREMGYPARAHIAGSNYQIMLPPVAYDAGLGELGRHGYLISQRFGSRIRIGAVTTDLPLIPDKPINFGVQDFCRICKKCADNCPSRAIPFGEKENVRGVEKWLLNMEQCLRYWRTVGTDCGLCMKVCPFSHPQAFVHDLVRTSIKRSSFARRVSIHGDDLFYGKKTRY